MLPIFVMGSVAVDITVQSSTSTVFSGLGGKGSNQAIAAKHAGGENVTLATKIGNDAWGQFALKTWQDSGLDVSAVIVDSTSATGITAVLLDELGENRIVRGENPNRSLSDTDAEYFASKLPDSGIFMTQLSGTIPVALKLLKFAKLRGLTTILDTCSNAPLPEDVWQYVDIITPNEHEARTFGNVPVRQKVITLGSRGVYISDGAKELTIPALEVNVLDSTGAGDAFNGAFAAKLAEGADIFEAAHFGNAAGAICASRFGAAKAMPYKDEIINILGGLT